MDAAQASLLLKNQYGRGKSVGLSQSRRVLGRHQRRDRMKPSYDGIVTQRTEPSRGESSDEKDEFPLASRDRQGKAKTVSKSSKIDLQLGRDAKKREGKKQGTLQREREERFSRDDSTDSDSSVARRRRHRRQRRSRQQDSSSDSDSDAPRRKRRKARQRRGRSNSSTFSSNSNSSSEDEQQKRRNRARAKRNRRSDSSSSSSEDEQQKRRNRARAKRMERQTREQNLARKDKPVKSKDSDKEIIVPRTSNKAQQPSITKDAPTKRRATRSPSSSSSTSSSSDGDSDSSSSSSSSEESSTHTVAKPIFVPKHIRQRTQQTQEEQDLKRDLTKQLKKEKRIQQSRTLVAQVVSQETVERNQAMDGHLGDQNEFDESGGSTMPPPSDKDPESNEREAMEQREAWEVRELLRVLRDLKDFVTLRTDEMEMERRRKMTDEERYQEDMKDGKYRRPGEQRRRNGDGTAHMQKYHHRGAFYMDEDTLGKAGKDDIRHKAAEYALAATGDDKFNKKAMPKVLQVKKFGFAGYSTKYKGLAEEDTTDKASLFISKSKDQRKHQSNHSSR